MNVVDLCQGALEADSLFVEEQRLRLIRGGKVRVDRFEIEIRAGEEIGQRPAQIVEAESEAVTVK